MPNGTAAYQESLTGRVRSVIDAFIERNGFDRGFPVEVFDDSLVVERDNGEHFRYPYSVDENDGAITFDEPQRVELQFVPARNPAYAAWDFMRATYRLLFGSSRSSSGDGQVPGTPAVPAPNQGIPDGQVGMFVQAQARVCSESDDERYVGGLVVVPGRENAYNDEWRPHDIRTLAHRFMERYRHVDTMHTSISQATPIESIYLPTPDEGGQASYNMYGQEAPGGSWWLGVRVNDDQAWEKVKNGELRGFSLFAVTNRAMSAQYNFGVQAPPGRTMTANEWDVTMVSLVDDPAVYKATFFRVMRDPAGEPSLQALDGKDLDDQVLGQLRRALSKGGPDMRGFRTMAAEAAHEGQDQLDSQAQSEETTEETPSTQEEGNTEERTNQAPDPAAGGEENTESNDQDSAAALTREDVQEIVGAAVREAMAPIREELGQMAQRYRKLSAGGALPGDGEGGDSEEGSKNREYANTLPSWANLGGGRKNKKQE